MITREPSTTSEPSTKLVSSQQLIVDVTIVVDCEVSYQIKYYETDGDESLWFDLELEDDDFTSMRNRFPRYDHNCVVPVFIVSMIFDSSKQSKNVLIKYLVAIVKR